MQDGFLLRRLDVKHETPQALAMAQARAATDLSRGSVNVSRIRLGQRTMPSNPIDLLDSGFGECGRGLRTTKKSNECRTGLR